MVQAVICGAGRGALTSPRIPLRSGRRRLGDASQLALEVHSSDVSQLAVALRSL
jgi:hypothetical protein